jgi:hypothetical protein
VKGMVRRVEPWSRYRERWKAPTSAGTRHGGTVEVSASSRFDPATGAIVNAPIEHQKLVLDQLKRCVEAAAPPLRLRISPPSTRPRNGIYQGSASAVSAGQERFDLDIVTAA